MLPSSNRLKSAVDCSVATTNCRHRRRRSCRSRLRHFKTLVATAAKAGVGPFSDLAAERLTGKSRPRCGGSVPSSHCTVHCLGGSRILHSEDSRLNFQEGPGTWLGTLSSDILIERHLLMRRLRHELGGGRASPSKMQSCPEPSKPTGLAYDQTLDLDQ